MRDASLVTRIPTNTKLRPRSLRRVSSGRGLNFHRLSTTAVSASNEQRLVALSAIPVNPLCRVLDAAVGMGSAFWFVLDFGVI